MQNWTKLYLELANKIKTNIPAIEWIDLWHSQAYHLEEEHAFPTPSVFLAFRSNNMKNTGEKIQLVTMQVDVFLFYETFSDTYLDGINQTDALEFLDSMDKINALFHASQGVEYSNMSRKSFSPVDTGGASNLYLMTYECMLVDYSAAIDYEEGSFADLSVEPFDIN